MFKATVIMWCHMIQFSDVFAILGNQSVPKFCKYILPSHVLLILAYPLYRALNPQ